MVILEEDSLVELEDPIELSSAPKGVLQGSRYTTLGQLAEAEMTDDL